LNVVERVRTYSRITNLWGVARRYFVNNFYDGMLTVLGILLGFFVVLLKDNLVVINSNLVILAGLGSSLSMLISGITGSYLSERAEQKKIKDNINKSMIINEELVSNNISGHSIEEIEKSMLIKIKKKRNRKRNMSQKEKKQIKTIQQKAESFASVVVSIINGFSPFLGGVVPLIPFTFVTEAGLMVFIISFLMILICIIMLGTFLGIIARESIIKNILQMVFAFFITIIITLLFLG
jgi:VIT1/CCC1 family predicted Fe2+/Mn2+ transporter